MTAVQTVEERTPPLRTAHQQANAPLLCTFQEVIWPEIGEEKRRELIGFAPLVCSFVASQHTTFSPPIFRQPTSCKQRRSRSGTEDHYRRPPFLMNEGFRGLQDLLLSDTAVGTSFDFPTKKRGLLLAWKLSNFWCRTQKTVCPFGSLPPLSI